jgi:hypothetical protein
MNNVKTQVKVRLEKGLVNGALMPYQVEAHIHAALTTQKAVVVGYRWTSRL